jgi:hypothetical protein
MNMLKKYLPLYLKELKALRGPFIILSGTYLFFVMFFLVIDVSQTPKNLYYYRNILQVMVMLNMLIFPGLLIYSFYEEKMNNTSHQLLSFPVPRYAFMINKLLAMFSVAAAVALVLGLCNYIIELRVTVIADPKNYHFDDTKMIAFRFISVSYAKLCIAAATVGILSAMKRYRVISMVLIFGGFIVLYEFIYRIIIRIYTHSVLTDEFARSAQAFDNLTFVVNVYLPLIAGSLFLPVGLYVFHKYGDN